MASYNKLDKIKRGKEISVIIMKYGLEEIFDRSGIEKILPEKFKKKHNEELNKISSKTLYERIRMSLEELGPTFVKFGQMLSNRQDIFPSEFLIELQKLQDGVETENVDIFKKLTNELNINVDEVFSHIDVEPMASASMGQVFSAVLKSGNKVVIKVKRDNINDKVKMDLTLMKDGAKFLEKHYEDLKKINLYHIVESFENMMMEELSFNNELKNMEKFAKNFKSDDRIHVPVVYRELSNDSILCMEQIEGFKVTDREKIIKSGYKPEEVANLGLDLYFIQVLKHGFFHADPHPGNILFREDGKMVFIDFGAMGRFSPSEIELLEDLTMNLIKKDVKASVKAIKELSTEYNVKNEKKMEKSISKMMEMVDGNSLAEISLGEMLEEIKKIFSENSILMDENVYLLVKGIGQIEGIGRDLNPNLNVIEVMQPYARDITMRKYNPKRILEKGFNKFTTYSENWLELPNDLKQLLQKISDNELKHKHELIGFDKFNQLLEDLILAVLMAALFIGSSILILANIPPKFHEIPVLGLAGFVITAILAVILFNRKNRKK